MLGENRKIAVSINHFAASVPKNVTVHHYNVQIVKPEPVSAALFKKVIEQFVSKAVFNNYWPVYDGKKNIFMLSECVATRTQAVFCYADDANKGSRMPFMIRLQPVGQFDMDVLNTYLTDGSASSTNIPMRQIQALDIALKYAMVNRMKIFASILLSEPQPGKAISLGNGLEMWAGHFQSLRLGWKPFLIVNATQRSVVKAGPVVDVLLEMFGTCADEVTGKQLAEFDGWIKNYSVKYPRGGYHVKVRCNGLKGSAVQETFLLGDGLVTVKDYFERKYKIQLEWPHLPCLWLGSPSKNNLVPMELCSLVQGQLSRRKLTDRQTTEMIRHSVIAPVERKRRILKAVQDMQLDRDPYATNYGVRIASDQMTQMMTRVMPAPTLQYGQGKTVVPVNGGWNLRGLTVLQSCLAESYAVVSLVALGQSDVELFLSELSRAGQQVGMTFGARPAFVKCISGDQVAQEMERIKRQFPALQLLLVVIGRKGDPNYNAVKQLGDVEQQIMTQCVTKDNVTGRGNGPKMTTLTNICLKINAKLGGVNNTIEQRSLPTMLDGSEQVMIMGADVTQPPHEAAKGCPSIAAVVASVDPRAVRYSAEIRMQESRQENISDMKAMVQALLLRFFQANRSSSTGKPQRIILYRDGVSQGQYECIIRKEVQAIRDACSSLQEGYRPPITFIVVHKRHHTRFFVDNPRDATGKAGNVPPGTVVDQLITHPVENDFLLVSHHGLQGTSRPTHYHLLWDDSDASTDDVQQLTYYLCYLFARCTMSVSYPAPCYYSHLVAYRGNNISIK